MVALVSGPRTMRVVRPSRRMTTMSQLQAAIEWNTPPCRCDCARLFQRTASPMVDLQSDQHATPLLRSRRATPRQGNTQGSGVQCDGARRYLSKMGAWAFTGGKCPVIIQHLFEPSKILGETPLSEGRCLLSANGEYFKPGATRPSSEFRSLFSLHSRTPTNEGLPEVPVTIPIIRDRNPLQRRNLLGKILAM
jgi:hypothetical protein